MHKYDYLIIFFICFFTGLFIYTKVFLVIGIPVFAIAAALYAPLALFYPIARIRSAYNNWAYDHCPELCGENTFLIRSARFLLSLPGFAEGGTSEQAIDAILSEGTSLRSVGAAITLCAAAPFEYAFYSYILMIQMLGILIFDVIIGPS